MTDIMEVSCRLTTPGGELEINDRTIYKLSADTRQNIQVTWRRQEVTSPFVPGTFTVQATEDMVSENVGVYVYGSDHADLRKRLAVITEAFSQHVYTITWDYGEDVYAWYCQYADYSIDTRREFQHSRMALAQFTVPRYPSLIDL